MSSSRRPAPLAALLTTVALAAAPGAQAAPAGTTHYPDLQTVIPTNSFSIVNGADGREFRYTHLVFSAGPGPLEVQPSYNGASGNYTGEQTFFTHDSNGTWSLVERRKVPDAFVFHAAHGHFHFPLASFGLFAVAADGGFGPAVTMSPKNGFCIADSYMYDRSVPHAGTFVGTMGSCADPLTLRGMTVGAVDEYDYRDPGQAIPFQGVPDGTYWFRAMTDPNNDFKELDESNNETDVKVMIANGVVTPLETIHPNTTPPQVGLSSPLDGARVSSTVTLKATAADGAPVQFLVDGMPVGASNDTAAPYTFAWNTTSVVDGEHWIAARTTDSLGRVNTSDVAVVNVANTSAPPTSGPLALDASVSRDGSGTITSPALSTLTTSDLVLAFVSSDGPSAGGAQTLSVTGGGLQWSLVRRANTRAGTAEIWKATATGTLNGLQVTSTQSVGGFHQSMHVAAFSNAGGVGTSAAAGASSGASKVTVTTTRASSWVWGVGNDWDGATARTLPAGQTLAHQWVDNGVGDTFWMQYLSSPTAALGTNVTLSDTAPANHQWNLAAVEILPGASFEPPPVDVTPPQVRVSEPAGNSTVKGIVQIGAVASDDVGVAKVQFKLDGNALGAPVTSPPFATAWDTRNAAQGQHTLTAEAVDAAGNTGTSASVLVNVDNSAPAPAQITIDKSITTRARGTLRSPALTTAAAGEQIVAFVAMDGPATPQGQRATVSGGGLTWTLVKRSDSQYGASEIWTARATGTLANQTITATPFKSGFDGLLHVIAFKNASGVGVAGASGAGSGAPDIYLPGVQAGSWVFAVGNDWDGAVGRTPVSGQVLQHQWIDSAVGDTFWTQSPASPNSALGLVTIHDSAPTNHQFNYAAAEVVAAPVTTATATAFASAATAKVSFATPARAGTVSIAAQGHTLLTGICPLAGALQLPSASDVTAASGRKSALRRAGKRAARVAGNRRS